MENELLKYKITDKNGWIWYNFPCNGRYDPPLENKGNNRLVEC